MEQLRLKLRTFTITKEKRQEYNRRFYARNLDKLHEKIVCPVCHVSYTYYNKSRHERKSKLHQLLLRIQ